MCGLATPPRHTHRYSLCASWETRASAPKPAPGPGPTRPAIAAVRRPAPPAEEARPEDLEKVLGAIRNNPYLRTASKLGTASRMGGRRARAAAEALVAAGRVHRVGEFFRITGEENAAAAARVVEGRPTPRERREAKLAAHRHAAQRRQARERDIEALAGAFADAVEHASNVRRTRTNNRSSIPRQPGQYTSLRALYVIAVELGKPLSELIAAAEVRAGLREQTDVFQMFWRGHGKREDNTP